MTAILGRASQCIKIRLLAPDKMGRSICLLTEPHTCISRSLAAPLTEEGSGPHSMSVAELRPEPTVGPRICSALPGWLPLRVLVLLPRLTLAVWELKLQEAINWGQNLHMPHNQWAKFSIHSCYGCRAWHMRDSIYMKFHIQISILVSTSIYNLHRLHLQTVYPISGLPNS